MKTFHHSAQRVFAAALLVLAAMLSARGAQKDERAGYQGIPVRNGLNRGIVGHEESAAAALRYPRLPRRLNETDLDQAGRLDSRQARNQNDEDRAGYGGIPQRSARGSRSAQTADLQEVERGGYAGIPQRSAKNDQRMQPNVALTKRTSALLTAK